MKHGGWILVGLGLTLLFGFMLWALQASWKLGGDSTLGFMGWGWMIAGSVLTGALTAVLMWLMFHSSRRGYDERVGLDEDDRPDPS